MMSRTYINISLPPELAAEIRHVACAQDKSLSQFFREAAGMYLAQLAGEEVGDIIDPAAILKAHNHMKMIMNYTMKVQAVMKECHQMCFEI
ncbi:MAG: ribbon-helix-helix domain-containing protein [Planctomycetota bacterium]|jgi:metal-responsive CopG/Arc/MetJ family transcriptional regulator